MSGIFKGVFCIFKDLFGICFRKRDKPLKKIFKELVVYIDANAKNGIIVQSLHGDQRLPVNNAADRITMLSRVTINGVNQTEIPLRKVYDLMIEYGNVVTANATDEEIREYFAKVVPDYDAERIYNSELRKILTWFHLIYPNMTGDKQQVPVTRA
jgi:hypothetical protein